MYASRVLAALVVLATTLLGAANTALAQDEPPSPPILFGVHPGLRESAPTRVESAVEVQNLLGAQLGVVRRYLLWEDDPGPDPLVQWTLNNGSKPHISVVPRRADRSPIPWSEIATATPGSDVYAEIQQWAAQISALGQPVWFTFHHEPEILGNMVFGTDADFVAAWRQIHDVFEAEGVTNAEYVWVMTDYAFSRPAEDRRAPDRWYPGDDWVDHIGADPYNWTSCRVGINNPWRSFESLATPLRDYAAQHPTKGLVIAEFGSAEDLHDPDRKAEWVTEIRRLLRTPEWSQTVGIVSFHRGHLEEGSTCDWWVDSSAESLAAYQGLIDDPIFGGDGPPPPPPDGDPPFEGCLAELTDPDVGIVQLTLADYQGTEVIRRNGNYLASIETGQNFFTDDSPVLGENVYTLRVWDAGGFIDFDCGTVTIEGEPPEPLTCTALATGTTVDLTWTATPETEIVRRDGNWRSSPTADATAFSEVVSPGSYDYSLRAWGAGGFTDVPCGTVVVEGAAPTCSVALTDTTATVTWENMIGSVVVRRDGAWIATPGAASSHYDDVGLDVGTYEYTVRTWAAGSMTDTACGAVTVG